MADAALNLAAEQIVESRVRHRRDLVRVQRRIRPLPQVLVHDGGAGPRNRPIWIRLHVLGAVVVVNRFALSVGVDALIGGIPDHRGDTRRPPHTPTGPQALGSMQDVRGWHAEAVEFGDDLRARIACGSPLENAPDHVHFREIQPGIKSAANCKRASLSFPIWRYP